MREAKRAGVRVLLDGQGGDETLCGYRKYYMFYIESLMRQRRWSTALSELRNLIRNGDRDQWDLVSAGSRYLPSPLQSRVWSLESYIHCDFERDWREARSDLGLAGKDVADRQISDLVRFSVPALLRYEDRNSMAWSIEARVPFLDHRLVEFSVGLPVGFKLRNGTTKSVLRQGLRRLVPAPILNRDNKLGFNTPMTEWLTGELQPMIEDGLGHPGFAAGLIDGTKLLGEFRRRAPRREADAIGKVFRAFLFDAWMRRFGVQP